MKTSLLKDICNMTPAQFQQSQCHNVKVVKRFWEDWVCERVVDQLYDKILHLIDSNKYETIMLEGVKVYSMRFPVIPFGTETITVNVAWCTNYNSEQFARLEEAQSNLDSVQQDTLNLLLIEKDDKHNKSHIRSALIRLWFNKDNRLTPCDNLSSLLEGAVDWALHRLSDTKSDKFQLLVAHLVLGSYDPSTTTQRKYEDDVYEFFHYRDKCNPGLSRAIDEYRLFGYTHKSFEAMLHSRQWYYTMKQTDKQ